MKRKRTLAVLLAALVVVFGGVIAANAFEKHVESISTVDEVVFTLDEDALTEVKWTYEDTDLDFVKADDVWKSTDDDSFPVDQEAFSTFLQNFAEVHASFIIDEVEDYEQYGLAEPEASITFVTADGETTISCGTFSTMDSQRYIMLEQGTVYLIDDDIEEYLTSNRDDMMDNDDIPYLASVDSIEVTGAQNMSIIYEEDADYTYTTSYNYYIVNGDEYLPLSDSLVTTYMDLFTHTDFNDYVTYTATEEQITKWGLDDPDISVHVKGNGYDTDFTDDNDLGEEIDHTLYFSKIDDDNVYLRVDDSSIVYSYPVEDYQTLIDTDYNALRPTQVVDITAETISSITASVDSDSYTIEVDNSGDETVYTVNDIETAADTIVDDITELAITEYDSSATPGTEEFNICLVLNDDDSTTLDIHIYRVDGDQCLVELNDEILGYMDRSLMTTLKEDFAGTILNLGKEEDEAATAATSGMSN